MSKSLPFYAFETLSSHLSRQNPPKIQPITHHFNESLSQFPQQCPLFVSWHKGPTHELRGCIGTFSDLPLLKGVEQYSLVSAVRDSRFSPISKTELSQLSVVITLLTHFEEIEEWDDWEVGKHGLRLSFEDGGEEYNATFLPQVAAEQKWDKLTTIRQLIKKSGYVFKKNGKIDDLELDIVRYQGDLLEMSYEEYETLKKQF